ncbi:MAG: glutathione S-transferase N-terminal domain-containing protein [Pseudomonadota bacterium]
MIKFYYSTAPNPMKVALFLEEAGLDYEAIPIDTRRGEQHSEEFLKLNPNAKCPVIVDDGTRVFDSNAILLYLAEKTGKFLPSDPAMKGELYSWLMFVASGLGPYNGQAVHFLHFAPKFQYAIERYLFESDRHFGILDAELAKKPYILGDDYSIVDMAMWGWTNPLTRIHGDSGFDKFPHLKAWHAKVNERPAVARAKELGKDYNTPFDEEAKRHMFRHVKAA